MIKYTNQMGMGEDADDNDTQPLLLLTIGARVVDNRSVDASDVDKHIAECGCTDIVAHVVRC